MFRLILSLACILAGPATAAAVPELAGFFVLSDQAHFVFVDSETDSTSGWLSVGDTFAGWLIEEFQPEHDTVVLKRGDERILVSLRTATILDDGIAFSGDIAVGAGRVIKVSQGSLRYGEVTAYPVTDDITLHLKATRLPDGNIRYECKFETLNEDGTTEVLSAPRITNRPGMPFSMVVGDLDFTLQP